MQTCFSLLRALFERLTILRRRAVEAGEGVISAAIAVLIVAALGVAAYGGFNTLFNKANDKASTQVDQIGGGGGGSH